MLEITEKLSTNIKLMDPAILFEFQTTSFKNRISLAQTTNIHDQIKLLVTYFSDIVMFENELNNTLLTDTFSIPFETNTNFRALSCLCKFSIGQLKTRRVDLALRLLRCSLPSMPNWHPSLLYHTKSNSVQLIQTLFAIMSNNRMCYISKHKLSYMQQNSLAEKLNMFAESL